MLREGDEFRPVSVLIVEDSSVTCLAIRLILSTDRRIAVVQSLPTAADAIGFLEMYPVDVVTLDLNLPDARGAELVERMMAAGHCGVVVVSGSTDQHARARALGAADAFAKHELLDRKDAFIASIHRAAGFETTLLRLSFDATSISAPAPESQLQHRRNS